MALSAEDKAEIANLIKASFAGADLPGMVTKTVDGALKGLDLPKQITAGIDAATQKTAADVAKAAKEAGAVGATGDGKKGGIEDNPAFKQMQAQLAANEAKLAEATTAREIAEAKASTDALLGSLRAQLTKGGVPPERLEHAVAYLHNMQGRAVYDDTGKMGLKFSRKATTGGYDEVLGFDDGVKEWLAGDDGKSFLPAVGSQGTGDANQGGPGVRTPGGKFNKDLAVSALLGAARNVDR